MSKRYFSIEKIMKKIRVHIAVDHQILIDGIIAVLKSEDNIEVAGSSLDGNQVLDWFNSNIADVLVLDMNLPNLDGISVLRELQKKEQVPKTIILSSHKDKKRIKAVLKLGAKGFLTKKCTGENIVEAIYAVNSGSQYFSKSILEKTFSSFKSNNKGIPDSKDGIFFNAITDRELEVIKLIAQEYNTKEIAEELYISVNTVETHRKHLLKKLNVKNAVGLAMYAVKNNLI